MSERQDEFIRRVRKNWIAASTGGILCATLGWLLISPIGQKLAYWSYDLPFGVRGAIYPKQAVMVYMDEPSHQQLDQSFLVAWDRALHAQLLDQITLQHPAGVIFDIVFSGPGPSPEADKKLADAIKRNGKVILAADLRTGGYGDIQSSTMKGFDKPYDPFYDAADSRCGSDAVSPDDDLIIRAYRPADPENDQIPSEAWAGATLVNAPLTRTPSNEFKIFNINYYGPSGTIPNVSYYKVILGDPSVPTNFFTGKMVFVGERLQTRFAGDRKDEYPTPFSYWDKKNLFTCGVELHATAFLNLIRGDCLFRIPERAEYAVILLTGLLAGFGLTLLRPMTASLTALLLIVLAAVADYFLFAYLHLWFAWVIIALAQVPLAWIFSVAVNSVQLYVEKQLVEHSLSLYLSPKLVKKFASNPKLLKPGAEKQMLTILFSDIAGFTTISEGMDSDDLARLMNVYFQSAVQNCIHATDGTVVKYIGDAIFAFWNAPDLQGDHSYRACEAALRFRNQDAQHINGKELITRIGLHTGVANVGNFGSDSRVDYTAIGENINLASRMEGLNKYLGTRVLLTSDTQAVAGPRLITRYLGLFRLKGFERAVGVYELTGWKAEEAATQELRARFADALEKLGQKDFEGAEAAFRRTLEIAAEDGPSMFYLEQLEELRATELPPGWKGEITLKDK